MHGCSDRGNPPSADGTFLARSNGVARRMLILEDERLLTKHLARLFAARGYEVQTVGTVASFVAVARGERFEMLLLDLHLPDGSGLDAWEEARATQTGARAILMTAHGSADVARRARELGIHAVLSKPLNLSLLLSSFADTSGPPA